MKLTFTTSLALLTAATASSTNGGGLRSRRLNLFAADESALPPKKRTAPKADKEQESNAATGSKQSGAKSDKNQGGKKAEGNALVSVSGKSSKVNIDLIKSERSRQASGIKVGELTYVGNTILGSFTLSDEYISDATREALNAEDPSNAVEEGNNGASDPLNPGRTLLDSSTDISGFKIGLYQYMAQPDCDGLPPIRESTIEIQEGDGSDEASSSTGTFTILTDAAMKDEWGTGYDLFLLDETGCHVILGPEAVTITLTEEAQEAEDAAAEERSRTASTTLAKAQKKTAVKATYKKTNQEIDEKIITITTKPALASDTYVIYADKDEYGTDENIVVTYSFDAPVAAEDRRLKKKKNPEANPEHITDEQVVDEQPQPALTVEDEEMGEGEQQEEDGGEQQEEEEEEEEEGGVILPSDLAVEEETECDPTDVTTYKIGIFMKMANPQGGKLPSIYSVPLCDSENCSADEISTGSITVSATELDTAKWGTGFDAWVLDCKGDGIAGPIYFAIDV